MFLTPVATGQPYRLNRTRNRTKPNLFHPTIKKEGFDECAVCFADKTPHTKPIHHFVLSSFATKSQIWLQGIISRDHVFFIPVDTQMCSLQSHKVIMKSRHTHPSTDLAQVVVTTDKSLRVIRLMYNLRKQQLRNKSEPQLRFVKLAFEKHHEVMKIHLQRSLISDCQGITFWICSMAPFCWLSFLLALSLQPPLLFGTSNQGLAKATWSTWCEGWSRWNGPSAKKCCRGKFSCDAVPCTDVASGSQLIGQTSQGQLQAGQNCEIKG